MLSRSPGSAKSHDLTLPDWGPYSKRYAGLSHIPAVHQGLRFDLALIPGFYRRQLVIPNVKWESGHHPWEAAPDLRFYSYRFELEWKDQVYCDAAVAALTPQARLLRCTLVNRTEQAQNLVLHLMAFMNFPPVRPYSDEPIQDRHVTLPDGGLWVDAVDYHELHFAHPRPTDGLVENGLRRAEVREHGLVHGSGIGQGFGQDAGDSVVYGCQTARPFRRAALTLRYRLDSPGPVELHASGVASASLLLTGQEPDAAGFSLVTLQVGKLAAGQQTLRLVSGGGAGVTFDGFAVTEANQVRELRFPPRVWTPAPKIIAGPDARSLQLKYPDVDVTYGLAWTHPDFEVRQIRNHEIDSFLRLMAHEHQQKVLVGPQPDQGHFTDIFLRPILVPPHSAATLWGLACAGGPAEVDTQIQAFLDPAAERESPFQSAAQAAIRLDCLPAGEPYRFSQERMAATELMNVVYPVYTRRQFIRHNTPGKWWDCLYTWDSGFIGLALLELDRQRCVDCLNAYVTDPGDEHAAFVYFGTPVPTQIYLLHELWNQTQDRQLLEYFYPRLRQYYEFLAGRSGGSTTRTLPSQLLRTWEYFWESGGWDDYPAQVHTNAHPRRSRITCAAITAHAIRSARILRAAAEALGAATDLALYDADIALFTEALQRHAWDSEAGTFSYVVHDDLGRPQSYLRHASGVNYNLGLDGVMPLVAGICRPEQEALFLNRLADPQHYWTPIGLSTVDQAAPYYRKDGYWNGSVWMPHQWFLWKTALDLGQGGFAQRIAATALELWKTEVEATYHCFEHFVIQSGRGAGWHQFSGLSSPVLAWFGAYHRPGRLTTGLDVWVEAQQFSNHQRSFRGKLKSTGRPRPATVLLNLQPGGRYTARWNGRPIPVVELHPGGFQVDIPFETPMGELECHPQTPDEDVSGH